MEITFKHFKQISLISGDPTTEDVDDVRQINTTSGATVAERSAEEHETPEDTSSTSQTISTDIQKCEFDFL